MQPRDNACAEKARVKELTRSLQGDSNLDAWAHKLQAAADSYIANKKPDPLDGFLVTHLR